MIPGRWIQNSNCQLSSTPELPHKLIIVPKTKDNEKRPQVLGLLLSGPFYLKEREKINANILFIQNLLCDRVRALLVKAVNRGGLFRCQRDTLLLRRTKQSAHGRRMCVILCTYLKKQAVYSGKSIFLKSNL